MKQFKVWIKGNKRIQWVTATFIRHDGGDLLFFCRQPNEKFDMVRGYAKGEWIKFEEM